jgi:uncharacterized protein YecT (DUF1311 family)
MKTNHDGTMTLMPENVWTSCASCGQRVTGDSIHTCSPQLKELTDEEIDQAWKSVDHTIEYSKYRIEIARAILRKAQEK